jgi:alkane 1-monooxygenase
MQHLSILEADQRKSWALRIALFLPFLLPLVFLRKVPVLHFAHPRWVLVAILYAYALPPVMDLIGGENRRNDHPARESWTTTAFEYVNLPRILCFKVLIIKLLMLDLVSTGRFDLIDCFGIAYLTGQSVSSYGIFIAHELLHRRSKFDKALSEVMMVTVMYPHFCIEHLYGHHKHAATPEDPATSRYGETVYRFLPRSIFGGVAHAWDLEVRRLARRGLHWFDYRNQMLRYSVEVLAFIGAVYFLFGSLGVMAFVVQSVVAIVTLEVINYVQHYGLERPETAPGQYETIGIDHSWNSECWFSNGYWLNLGRHSDHHQAPGRGFQMLRNCEHEPQLPAGFPAMFLLAFVPPLWFRVMNPRVEALRRGVPQDSAEASRIATTDSSSLNWASRILKGDGVLMGAAVAALLVADIAFGYPYGLITVSIACLFILLARRFVAQHPVST